MYMISLLLLFIFAVFCFRYTLGKRIPILMYHRIASVPGDRNALAPEKLEEQLSYLAARGYNSVTMRQVCHHYKTGASLPPKPVLLTFDDGYADNFTTALPLLQKYNMTAIVFPIAHWIGRENQWENFHKESTVTMNWEQLRRWKNAGMEIGCHTLEHPFLSACSEQRLREELNRSKKILEKNLDATIDCFCYPYGDFNFQTAAAAKQAGYCGAAAIFEHVPLCKINLYALPRIPIPARQKLWEFKLKVSRFHMIFIALRQWERNIKRILRKRKK